MANSAINSAVQLNGLQLLSISHLPDDQGARKIIAALGLDWPTHPGRFTERLYESEGDGVKLVWRSPRELLAIAHSDSALQSLRDAMVPGRQATAAVWNQSQAMALFELQGPDLDAWLTRLVDAEAIPEPRDIPAAADWPILPSKCCALTTIVRGYWPISRLLPTSATGWTLLTPLCPISHWLNHKTIDLCPGEKMHHTQTLILRTGLTLSRNLVLAA